MDTKPEEHSFDDELDVPYCVQCGEERALAFIGAYANGNMYKCKCCGNEFRC
jgi:hypothetical protein